MSKDFIFLMSPHHTVMCHSPVVIMSIMLPSYVTYVISMCDAVVYNRGTAICVIVMQ